MKDLQWVKLEENDVVPDTEKHFLAARYIAANNRGQMEFVEVTIDAKDGRVWERRVCGIHTAIFKAALW